MLGIKVMQILMILRLELMLAMLACLTVADEKMTHIAGTVLLGYIPAKWPA